MSLLAPSLLSADFAHLDAAVEAVTRAGVRILHVDVMDGHFVPNLTVGPAVVRSLDAATDLFLDCHLMVESPEALIPAFARAGADGISVHVEVTPHLHGTIQKIRQAGLRTGVVLNPATPLAAVDEILPDLDYVLIMSVNPGFSGQKFIPSTIDKVRRLDKQIRSRGLETIIEVDGGIGVDNARGLGEAGAGLLVAGSAVFQAGQPEAASRQLRALLAGVGREPGWVP